MIHSILVTGCRFAFVGLYSGRVKVGKVRGLTFSILATKCALLDRWQMMTVFEELSLRNVVVECREERR